MPSWKAWVQRPSGIIKMEGSASTLNLMKVENVASKQISIIDLKLLLHMVINYLFNSSYSFGYDCVLRNNLHVLDARAECYKTFHG